MTRTPDQEAPWGRCPRCRLPLVREQLPLQSWPGGVSMQGPPSCQVCTPDEIEQYLDEWGDPEE
jgi:hypothetical protein